MGNVSTLKDRRAKSHLPRPHGCYAIAVREAWAMLEGGELTAGQFLALCYEAAQEEAHGTL